MRPRLHWGSKEDFIEIQERLERIERILWTVSFHTGLRNDLLSLPAEQRVKMAEDLELLDKFWED